MSFKLDQSAIDWIDRLASERGENRSETMRAMLAYAQKRMPRGWQPPGGDDVHDGVARPYGADEKHVDPFPCQLGHRRIVFVTDDTYEAHMRRYHRAEARELGLVK